MKKFNITLFLILFIKLIGYSQSFLITNTNEKFEFSKKDFRKGKLRIKSKETKKYFEAGNIFGYYYFPENEFYFLKHYTFYFENLFNIGNRKISGNFFVKKIIDGKINVYRNIMSVGNENYEYFFLEKNDKFYNFYIYGDLKNDFKKNYKVFKSFFNDDPKTIKKLNEKIPSLTESLNIIQEYNLNKYSINKTENTSLGKILFYKDKGKEGLLFSVNEKEYYLNSNDKIEIELPINNENLVKIKNCEGNCIEIITASEFYTKCYELTDKGVLLKNSNSSYVKARLKYIDKKQKKH